MKLIERVIALSSAIGFDIKNLNTNKQDKLSFVEAVLNFGSIDSPNNNTKITIANTSVLAGSKIICSLSNLPTTDHSIDEIMILEIGVYATNIVAGVSFDIQAFSQHKTYGNVKVNYLIIK